MSQEALAEKIGVSRQAVSKWETSEAMPDMAKLMALADALDMSMDDLCGRRAASRTPDGAAVPAAPTAGRRAWALCGIFAAVFLLCFAAVLLPHKAKPTSAGSPALPDTVAVSGVTFYHNGGGSVYYCFTPSVVGEAYTYEITFSGKGGTAQTFEAPCAGGLCADTVVLAPYLDIFNVSVVISNGEESRAVPAATGLNLSYGTGASWQPAA